MNEPVATPTIPEAADAPSNASPAPIAAIAASPAAPAVDTALAAPRLMRSSRPSMMDRRSSTSFFWALLVTLMACLPPLMIALGDRLVISPAEQSALASAQETWLRSVSGSSTGATGSALVAFDDGLPRLDKPPMFAWMNIIAWTGL